MLCLIEIKKWFLFNLFLLVVGVYKIENLNECIRFFLLLNNRLDIHRLLKIREN